MLIYNGMLSAPRAGAIERRPRWPECTGLRRAPLGDQSAPGSWPLALVAGIPEFTRNLVPQELHHEPQQPQLGPKTISRRRLLAPLLHVLVGLPLFANRL